MPEQALQPSPLYPYGAPFRWLGSLANPAKFLRVAGRLIPWLAGITAVLLVLGLSLAAVGPADYQQGYTVLIMYIHVPAAWNAMFVYSVMTVAALGTLVWRHPLADAAQKAAAPLGAGFTLICLATGSLWGKPMWGTWWVWDARLTSVLILFLIYIGLVALWQVFEDATRAARAAAIFTLTASVIIPIIHYSVQWWNTLHQGSSVFLMGGSAVAKPMLWPLLIMAIAFTLLFLTLHLAAIRNEILRRRLRRLTILQASEGMIEHSSHAGFIIAAYVVAGVVIGTMIGSTIIDYRGLRRALVRFGARGLDNRE